MSKLSKEVECSLWYNYVHPVIHSSCPGRYGDAVGR